jgi:hypothetical protein
MRRAGFPLAATVLLLAVSCSVGDQSAAASAGVVRFHEMMDAGQFEAIYDQHHNFITSNALIVK